MKRQSKRLNKKAAETAKKRLNANDEGYVVTTQDNWYIPGLGPTLPLPITAMVKE